jgi:cellulose synthase/poly-beta-1,6-N-acetylglucosamine synthase-like glycosyltransferase
MWTDWIYWLSSTTRDQLPWLLAPLLFFDAPRYAASALIVWAWDFPKDVLGRLFRKHETVLDYTPDVAVIIVGFNEGPTIRRTLESVWGSYPDLEIVVVDDGSSDDMAEAANEFASAHEGVRVLQRPVRGGKSAALNFAQRYTKADVLVYIDSDCELTPHAIHEIIQPLREPSIGAVSGVVLGRNPFTNLVTWAQALEYLHCIFLGRMFSARLGILGIVSGAFGAYRRQAVEQVGGFDVGPGEDGDLTLRLRKCGYEIGFAPYAQCLTDLPTSWGRLLKQRRRWEWALVTHECRKHADLANIFSGRFRISNLIMLADRLLFNLVLQFLFWGYLIWVFCTFDEHTWKLFFLYYLCYVALNLLTTSLLQYYSNRPLRDFAIGLAAPLMPLYYFILRVVTSLSVLEETFLRESHQDDFVPAKVRKATWQW